MPIIRQYPPLSSYVKKEQFPQFLSPLFELLPNALSTIFVKQFFISKNTSGSTVTGRLVLFLRKLFQPFGMSR